MKNSLESCVKTWNLTSNTGSSLCKIENFFEVADNEKIRAVYTCPFKKEPFGYKMCLRIHPQGEGMGKNTHLTVWFFMMKSEYDSVLEWPVTFNVIEFILYGHDGNKNVVKRLLLDNQTRINSGCFKRPTSEMNIPYGFSNFVPIEDLSKYVDKDGSLFIKCNVLKL